jgi:hypothetical protein
VASRVPPSGRRNTGVSGSFAVSRNVQQILIDNSFGDSLIDKIALVAKLKSCASHVECDGHDPVGLGIEFGTV